MYWLSRAYEARTGTRATDRSGGTTSAPPTRARAARCQTTTNARPRPVLTATSASSSSSWVASPPSPMRRRPASIPRLSARPSHASHRPPTAHPPSLLCPPGTSISARSARRSSAGHVTVELSMRAQLRRIPCPTGSPLLTGLTPDMIGALQLQPRDDGLRQHLLDDGPLLEHWLTTRRWRRRTCR